MANYTALTGPYKYREHWFGNRTITSTPEQGTGWKATTGGTGTPTAKTLDGADSGALRLAHDSTSAAQWIALTHGDIKGYGVGGVANEGNLENFTVKATVTNASLDSNYALFVGMGGNYSGTLSSGFPTGVARVGFEVVGATVYARCYDGATDSGQVATGISLQSGIPQVFMVNFDKPNHIKFYCSNPANYGVIGEVCGGTSFTLVNQEGNSFQPYIHHGKLNNAATTTCDLDVICINGIMQ
ncbi:MAG TPA: hypothetical protein VFG04_03775 [Planctomycetaceae bacterium]|jgi:hypothetical protein|nr:hypothetical protein [Planctomycetaceae bacterium]